MNASLIFLMFASTFFILYGARLLRGEMAFYDGLTAVVAIIAGIAGWISILFFR